MTGVHTPDFREVRPTEDELTDWRRRYPRRRPPYRSQCIHCEKRIWHSGIAIGAHRRACTGRNVTA